jgi:hypothetical protein
MPGKMCKWKVDHLAQIASAEDEIDSTGRKAALASILDVSLPKIPSRLDWLAG